jgi:hypothetical protein
MTSDAGDPFASPWEVALLRTRMTMAATAEVLKMFTSSDDRSRRSEMRAEPQLDGRDASEMTDVIIRDLAAWR